MVGEPKRVARDCFGALARRDLDVVTVHRRMTGTFAGAPWDGLGAQLERVG